MDTLRKSHSNLGRYGVFWLIIICLSACVLARESQAEIYKFVKNGVVHYSNQPPNNTVYNTLQFSRSSSTSNSSSPKKRVTTRLSSSSTSPSFAYGDIIRKVASNYRIHPALIKAIIKVESNYNPKAVSPKGAEGLMQLMPQTAKRFGVSDSFDPEQNITGGAKYLRFLFNEFGENNLNLVLAGYNAGENAVRKYDNAIPPYTETQRYVKLVRTYYLGHVNYTGTKSPAIYKYVNKDGVITFTNVPRVTNIQ